MHEVTLCVKTKIMKYTLLFAIAFGLTVACSSKKENITENEPVSELVKSNETDDLMYQIDSDLENKSLVQSLKYTNGDHDAVEVIAYVDENEQIIKIEEYLLNGKTGVVSRQHFYYNGGAMFASKFITEKQPKDKESYYSEVVTFYDLKGNPSTSKERNADYEEYLDQAEFSSTQTEKHSVENALAVLKQQGHYETTFQGFVDSGPYSFLIVGENAVDGFSSSLSIQQFSPAIMVLQKQGKSALGNKLQVQFERYIDPEGYEMQILIDVVDVSEKSIE